MENKINYKNLGGYSVRVRLDFIETTAKRYGWRLVKWQKDIKMLSFKKGTDRINIYITKMTVATAVKHPKYGKAQLYRRHVSFNLLEKIFTNPRVHTKKGYFLRRDRK